jgi:hypothetical protein
MACAVSGFYTVHSSHVRAFAGENRFVRYRTRPDRSESHSRSLVTQRAILVRDLESPRFAVSNLEKGIRRQIWRRAERQEERPTSVTTWVRFAAPASLAVIALFGTAFGSVSGYWTSLRQEHAKAQSNLVLEAIKTPDPRTAAKNPRFLTQMGFLDDPDHKIKEYVDANDAPTLPTFPAPLALQSGLTILDDRFQALSDVEIELPDRSQCPKIGPDGFSKCSIAIGTMITLRKSGYGTEHLHVYESPQIRPLRGDH